MSCSTRGGVLQDNSADPMGTGRHQYFAHHGRPMIPDYQMNMGHFPGMMYGGGPQHPNYYHHGPPMLPGGAPGNMLHPPPLNGHGHAPPHGMMPMNQSMDNGMMDNGMYKQDYPSMQQGNGANVPPSVQMQNGNNNGGMGPPKSNNAGSNDMWKNLAVGQDSSKNDSERRMDMNNQQRNESMMMGNGGNKDDQRSMQAHQMQQGNNGSNMPSSHNNENNGPMRYNMMMNNQGNGAANGMNMMSQNQGMQKHGNMPMMGHYDHNSYYGQQHGHYPPVGMPYPPPPGHHYPQMNGAHNMNMMMSGHRGQMSNMYSHGPPGQHPQTPQAGNTGTMKGEAN